MFGHFTVNRKSLLMACGNRLSAVSQRKQPVCEAERIVLPVVHVWDQLAGDPALVRSHDETETANAASKPLADFPHRKVGTAQPGRIGSTITFVLAVKVAYCRAGVTSV